MKTQLKNKTANNHSLNTMNDKTYQLRRKVIDIIYEVKKLCNIPRIEVRIVSGGNENNCGYAYLNANIIHINETYVNKEYIVLKFIVLHELVHAITGFKHDDNCPLMSPYLPKTINEKIITETFLKYIK
jgi:predicted metal-dependent hydrolase